MGNKIVEVNVLKGKNGVSLVIGNYRVSNEKIYGMLTPIYTFEVATDDILQAIGEERKQGEGVSDKTDFTIAELQARNERLKHLAKGWLEEKKTLNDKLDKIEQIVNDFDGSTPSMIKQFSEIQKVLEGNN